MNTAVAELSALGLVRLAVSDTAGTALVGEEELDHVEGGKEADDEGHGEQDRGAGLVPRGLSRRVHPGREDAAAVREDEAYDDASCAAVERRHVVGCGESVRVLHQSPFVNSRIQVDRIGAEVYAPIIMRKSEPYRVCLSVLTRNMM